MKYIVIIFLIIIFGSLGSALFYMVKDKGDGSDRTVKALTFRIALSLALFLMLMGGYYFGILPNEKL